MSTQKERAFRFDLFITPDWRDRFDTFVNENLELPSEGRVLDVNCGTGAHSIELAERLREKGEVVGVDSSAERIELAQAKALAKKLDNVVFQQAPATALPFPDYGFDLVIGDASMIDAGGIEGVLTEMLRVTEPEGGVLLKLTTRGSFDEFFSVFWEALLLTGLVETVWPALDQLMKARLTVSEAEEMASRLKMRTVTSQTNKEEFSFETAGAFLTSPLIEDFFLGDWMSIVPESKHDEVLKQIGSIIDRDRHDGPFEVSIKATIIQGTK